MKIRSKALYSYLLAAGVLGGPEDAIAVCKREYRKRYKREWRRNARPRKEIRMQLTLKEFVAVKQQAAISGLMPTPYARKVLLASVEQSVRFQPDKDLSIALQLVSMAINALIRRGNTPYQSLVMLREAEEILLRIIRNNLT